MSNAPERKSSTFKSKKCLDISARIITLLSMLACLMPPSSPVRAADTTQQPAAPAPAFIERSEAIVHGASMSAPAQFRSQPGADGGVVVQIALQGKKEVEVEWGASKRIERIRLFTEEATEQRLTETDKTHLATLHAELAKEANKKNHLERSLLSTLEVLVVFVPSDEFIDTIERPAEEMSSLTRREAAPVVTPICEARGRCRPGFFDVGNTPGTISKVIGDPASNCEGRCGRRCDELLQKTRGSNLNVYTQECLDHDVCTGLTGTVLGECTNEFLLAIDSYFAGENCPHNMIGKWRTTIVYPHGGRTFMPTWIFSGAARSGRVLECVFGNCTPGQWTLKKDKVTVAYPRLANFTGVVSENDLSTNKGKVNSALFGKGRWRSRHLSIFVDGNRPKCDVSPN